jgi:hypothetical protein
VIDFLHEHPADHTPTTPSSDSLLPALFSVGGHLPSR